MAKPPKSKSPAWVQQPVYLAIRSLIATMQVAGVTPSIRAARAAGRAFGGSRFNRTRLGRAADNLRVAFPDWDEDRVKEYAIRSYEHLFTLGVEIAFAPRLLTEDGWLRHITIRDIGPAARSLVSGRPSVLITGHCGNWEVLGFAIALLGFPAHALYRPLDMAPLDAWLRDTRQRRGLILVDKFGALRQLPTLLQNGAPLAFVADQNGGDRGIFVPFFGRLTSTYKSIGLLAMQFEADVVCGYARRLGADEPGSTSADPEALSLPPGGADGFRFEIEQVDVITPDEYMAHPDPLLYLTARYRRAIEGMVRRVPDQYDWLHRVWRSRPRHERLGRPFPAQLRDSLAGLPWVTPADIEAIVDRSDRDARILAETGLSRLA